MPSPRGRPRDAQRLARKALREQRRRHRQFIANYLRDVTKAAKDRQEHQGIPRRSLRLEWIRDNQDLIAEGYGPDYTLVLFGEPEFDYTDPPPDGYTIIVR